MPLFKCKECHHEWENSTKRRCEWCGADSYVLEAKTSTERAFEALLSNKKLVKNLRRRWNDIRNRDRRTKEETK